MFGRFAAISLLLAAPALLHPCASVVRFGMRINIAEETAAIFWDPGTKTEHFVRRATFRTNAADLGFLVPTPTVPKLATTETTLLWWLAKAVDNRLAAVIKDTEAVTKGIAGASPMFVRTQRVGGYDAAILKGGPNQVANWLRRNKYPLNARTKAWLDPYMEKGWAITAFKVSANKTFADLQPVRLTFKSDRPFYPYREPKTEGKPGRRSLRVFVITDSKVKGHLGGRDWSVSPEADFDLSAAEADHVKRLLGTSTNLPGRMHLTSFMDSSSPRNGFDDLWF